MLPHLIDLSMCRCPVWAHGIVPEFWTGAAAVAKRRYQLTEALIAKRLEEGRGTGSGELYKPWLTIHDLSSQGLSSRSVGTKSRRIYHLFSELEFAAFLDCDWNPAVIDIREQFPLVRADTRRIAGTIDVRHPQDHGVDTVMTTDLLVDVEGRDGRKRQVAFSVKPSMKLADRRVVEKLEIERRYWSAQEISFWIITELELSIQRRRNLAWLYEWRWLGMLDAPHPGYWESRCSGLLSALQRGKELGMARVSDVFASLETSQNWPAGDALSAFRHLGATRMIAFDLEKRLDLNGSLEQISVAEGSALGKAAA